MRTLEDMLDIFGEKASVSELARMEQENTFDGALAVLQAYAKRHLGVDAARFERAKENSLRNWNGEQRSKDDLWLLMVCKKDAGMDSLPNGIAPPQMSFAKPDQTITEAELRRKMKSFTLELGDTRKRVSWMSFPDFKVNNGHKNLDSSGNVEELIDRLFMGTKEPKFKKLEAELRLPARRRRGKGSEQTKSSRTSKHRVRMTGLGDIVKGSGTFARCPSKVAYFFAKRATYKARIKGGKLEFVRFGTIKKLIGSLKQLGVAGFSTAWDIQFDQEPNNYILSRICKEGSVEMIDWVISLMHSRDILISRSSDCAGYVPSKLTDSKDVGMCLSQPLGKHYLQHKQFMYDERSRELFWVPCDGMTWMKVVVRRGCVTNTFKRITIEKKRGISRLARCRVESLKKNFS